MLASLAMAPTFQSKQRAHSIQFNCPSMQIPWCPGGRTQPGEQLSAAGSSGAGGSDASCPSQGLESGAIGRGLLGGGSHCAHADGATTSRRAASRIHTESATPAGGHGEAAAERTVEVQAAGATEDVTEGCAEGADVQHADGDTATGGRAAGGCGTAGGEAASASGGG